MMNLHKDVFARLAISAQKERYMNQRFKVPKDRYEIVRTYLEKSQLSLIERQAIDAAAAKATDGNSSKGKNRLLKIEKMDDKIDKMTNNPVVQELRAELEFAQELLKKIKLVDKDNAKIPSIEADIFRLKKLLDDKTYF